MPQIDPDPKRLTAIGKFTFADHAFTRAGIPSSESPLGALYAMTRALQAQIDELRERQHYLVARGIAGDELAVKSNNKAKSPGDRVCGACFGRPAEICRSCHNEFGRVDIVLERVQEYDVEVRRLEDLILREDGERCDACERVFFDGEYGEDCWLCLSCAEDAREDVAGGSDEPVAVTPSSCTTSPGEEAATIPQPADDTTAIDAALIAYYAPRDITENDWDRMRRAIAAYHAAAPEVVWSDAAVNAALVVLDRGPRTIERMRAALDAAQAQRDSENA